MNYRLTAIVIAMLNLSSCETSEETFLNFFEVSTSLTAASLEISSNGKSQPLIVEINSQNRIYGVGNGNRFHTDDYFQSVNYSRGFASENFIEIDGNVIQRTRYEDELNKIIIEESYDRAESFIVKTEIEKIFSDDFIYYAQNQDTGWILRENFNTIDIIKIEGSSYRLIQTLNGDGAVSIWFNGAVGYIMLDADFFGDQKTVYKSNNFGDSWSFVSTFSLKKDQSNTSNDVNYLVGYGDLIYAVFDAGLNNVFTSRPSDYMYLSRDGGNSWQFYQENSLRSFQFLDERNGVAIKSTDFVYNWEDDKIASRGILFKTSDGGKTWDEVSNMEIYADRIYFLNENIGLAMSYSVLQVTSNGGKDWRLLVYPLNELL
jgi:hypothetical protein